MGQQLPTSEYNTEHKKSIFDRFFTKTMICFSCVHRKKKFVRCNINVVEWLNIKNNQCKYYQKDDGKK